MIYNVIGLMSGSSLDGLDIAFMEIADVRSDWTYELKCTACIPFEEEMKTALANASKLSVPEFLKLNTSFGRWMGEKVNEFIQENELIHKVSFLASHGHTVFHDPENNTSTQIGDGATIAAVTGLTTISDLRNMDVALGGQGAPIVPIADRLFFKDYHFCLNLGGIANVTINREAPLAFDISPANQVLDFYARKSGSEYDKDGAFAKQGTCNDALLESLNSLSYYSKPAPKSLANSYSQSIIELAEKHTSLSVNDILATLVKHIVFQIEKAIFPFHTDAADKKMLVTGGGAHNSFLISQLAEALQAHQITVEVPDSQLVNNKESLAMALIGVLRWREENNVLASVSGAKRDSIGGAMWLGNV